MPYRSYGEVANIGKWPRNQDYRQNHNHESVVETVPSQSKGTRNGGCERVDRLWEFEVSTRAESAEEVYGPAGSSVEVGRAVGGRSSPERAERGGQGK